MKEKIAETVKEHLRYVVDSFAGVLSFDIDPALSEEENGSKIIAQTALVCSVIAVVNPIPLTEFIVLTPIHAKMTFHIGKAKGFPVTQERALEVLREVASAVGLSLAGGAVASFVKLVPVLGVLVYVPIVYGTTWAIGRAVEAYFDGLRSGTVPTAETLKELFKRELAKGKAQGASIRREEIDRAYRELKAKVEERERVKAGARADREQARDQARDPVKDDHAEKAPAQPPEASRITVRERPVRKPAEKTIGEDAAEPRPQPALVEKPAAAPRIEKTIGPETPPHGVAPVVAPVAAPVATVAAAPAAVAAPAKPNLVDELERLAKLRDLGALTPEEFDMAKKKLLS